MDETWWKKSSELDQDQRDIIELDLDGNYIVTGPPGSGKTNILLLRASYLNSAGLQNCIVLTYTRHLKEFVTSGGKVPNSWVKTFASWGRKFLRQRNCNITALNASSLSEPEARSLLLSMLQGEIAKIHNRQDFYDSILVDEIQDYKAAEVALLSSLTRRLYVVGDEHQRIFEPTGGIAAAVSAGCESKKLTAHYRMGRKICEVADKLMPGSNLAGTCYYDEEKLPSDVRPHIGDPNRQLAELAEALRLQVKTFPGQWFGVLAAKWASLDPAIAYLEENGFAGRIKVQRDGEDRTYDPECPICVMTIQSSKGGEFRGVHFLNADVFPHFTREKAYTVITRAKTTLDIYYQGNMEPALQSAVARRQVPKLDLDDA